MNIQLFRYLTLAQLFQNAISGQKNNSRIYDARLFARFFGRQWSDYYFVISSFLQLLGGCLLTMLWWHRGIMSQPGYISADGARRKIMFLQKLLVKTRRFFRRTEGASAIEYALIIAMVALIVITFVSPIGTAVTNSFQAIQDALTTSLPAAAPKSP